MILITGADGFVGNRLCGELLQRGCSIRGALWRPAKLQEGCDSIVVGDISGSIDWSNALRGVDSIIHLAARVHVMNDFTTDALTEFRKVNVEGTRRLAEEATKAGVKRLVFLSSVKVNGEGGRSSTLKEGKGQEVDAYTEEDPPHPEDAYAVSKWEAEQALRQIEAEGGLEVVIIRAPLVYGPGVKANFLQLMKAVQGGIPLPFGSICNHRSLIGLGNLVDAIIICTANPKAGGQTFLVSDSEDVSTPDLVRRIAAVLGKPPLIFPFPVSLLCLAGALAGKRSAVDRLAGSLTVDIAKIQREIGWKPVFTMEQELARTAEWFLKR